MPYDKNVPIPNLREKWPMATMQPGESTFLPGKDVYAVNNASQRFRIRKGWRFACRTLVENGVKGVRIWRIS